MSHEDRREHPRVKLDIPVFCSISVEGQGEIPCMVKNISASGLMAELPPAQDWSFSSDSEVLVHSCPEFLSEYREGVRGQVVWQSGNTVGLNFILPQNICSERLQEILEQCGFESC